MEPDIAAFLKRIVNTIFIGLLFLAVNTTLGVMYDLAFFEDHITWKNILFYIFFLTSFVFLIRYYLKIWNKPAD
jgi:ABC-type spermidine/putrescine transport system permease subunit II